MTTFNDLIRGRKPDPEYLRKEAIRRAAADTGWRDPEDAVRLAVGEEGEPEEVVARLVATRPQFLGPSGQMNARLRGVHVVPDPTEPEPPPPPPAQTGSADAGNAGSASGVPRPTMTDRIRAAWLHDDPEGLMIDRLKQGGND